ncbi:MAG TPA: hypothetical protein VKR56_15280 [Candidatus Cybelea sp.]|nr:hypothetical protein [Candidatus Cybelea sp.]
MGIAGSTRRECIATVLLTLLSGCGSAQPSEAPSLVPKTVANASPVAARSWIRRGSSSGDLLYASDNGGVIWVFSYPQGILVGEVQLNETGYGSLCSDSEGDIFVPEDSPQPEILEYAHGATQPIATLSDPDAEPYGCAVDPTTGNLAVTSLEGPSGQTGSVAIYKGAGGNPETYSAPDFTYYTFCGYDDSGNLFIDGSRTNLIAELSFNSSTFADIWLNRHAASGQVQWDGKYITLADIGRESIYRITVSGSEGKIVGHTSVKGATLRHPWQSWIEGGSVIRPQGKLGNQIGFWKYPAGGKAYQVVKVPNKRADISSVTISVGSSR